MICLTTQCVAHMLSNDFLLFCLHLNNRYADLCCWLHTSIVTGRPVELRADTSLIGFVGIKLRAIMLISPGRCVVVHFFKVSNIHFLLERYSLFYFFFIFYLLFYHHSDVTK